MIVKKNLLFAASIIKLFFIFSFFVNAIGDTVNKKYYSEENGILALIYHRFGENKYPSTNVKVDMFKEQIKIIKNANMDFYDPKDLKDNFDKVKKKKKILITVDDAFSSFYDNAWPIIKKNKIPFILFVSTETVGNLGYMNWEQISEIEKYQFAFIGNHSHSHDYLINFNFEKFKKDIDKSIEIFKLKLGYNPIYFSYPFGEYSLQQQKYISEKFDFAFGQHSGVIDLNKNKYELSRFPINEQYGNLERFSKIIKYLPLQYKKLTPEDKFISQSDNTPIVIIEFFQKQKNIQNVVCYSNEGNKWRASNININNNILTIKFNEKFTFRRGRINCTLNDKDGWRFLGIQFTIN